MPGLDLRITRHDRFTSRAVKRPAQLIAYVWMTHSRAAVDYHRVDLRHHHLAVAVSRRDQTLAASFVDISTRPRVRGQDRPPGTVGRAKVHGCREPTSDIDPFMRLVNDVMTVAPYVSARRVFWVTDNGSSHRGAASVKRLNDAYANAHLIHLPIHASWLNQVKDLLLGHPTRSPDPQRLR